MASRNPFDILVDEDTEDPIHLIAKLPSPPPGKKGLAQIQPIFNPTTVTDAKNDAPRGSRGGFRGGSRGCGGGRGFKRDSTENENPIGYSNGNTGGYTGPQEGETGKNLERRAPSGSRGGFRGERRGGFSNGDSAEGERPRRTFDRRSGTGQGNEFKREGAGRGNWGTPTEDITPETEEPIALGEKVVDSEKVKGTEESEDADKDVNAKESEEKEAEEDKEMTLEEYEKMLEEKRSALLALKPEERKVNLDKELESMQLLSNKKNDEDVFVKLVSDKDKRKDAIEKAKKSLSINEFLKPLEGETYNRLGGRGRGRGQDRGGRNYYNNVKAPSIEDIGQFPSLAVK